MEFDFDEILKEFGIETGSDGGDAGKNTAAPVPPAEEEGFVEAPEETVEAQPPEKPPVEETADDAVPEAPKTVPDRPSIDEVFAAEQARREENRSPRRRSQMQPRPAAGTAARRRTTGEGAAPVRRRVPAEEKTETRPRRVNSEAQTEKPPRAHRADTGENNLPVKEDARAEKRRRRQQEKEAAIAEKEAARRRALNERDADREAKLREREEIRETRRLEKAAYDRRHFQERRQGTIALIIFLLILALAITGVIYAGRKIATSDKNLPNVFVDDIAVGSLTREETKAALLAGGWEERAAAALVVNTYNNVSVEVDPTEAGTVMSLEDALNAACSYGRDGSFLEGLIAYVESFFSHADVNRIHTSLNTAYLQQKASELEEKLTSSLGEEPYVVDLPGEKLVVPKGQGSMKLDSRALFEAITQSALNGDRELTFTQLSAQPVMPAFDAIYAELAADPVDARFSDDGRFTVIPETVGVWFDVEGAKAAWAAAQPGETITLPISVTYPATTAEGLQGMLYHDLLGAMTTKYTNSTANRCSNVRLATSKINGTVLYPGDVISYNETVGARTEEAGFLPAPAYTGVGEDGVKDEIGGGACQVSSTLYCASIYAFLETVERTAHIYPVNYIQVGTDATVTIPEDGGNVMDLKFKNSKNYPIKIIGYTEETEDLKTVTFEIWGTLEEDDYMPVEFDNTYYWMLDYDRVIEPSHPDRTGYKIKFTHERYAFEDGLGAGMRTLTHREVYNAATGELVLDEIINPKISTGYAMDTYYNHG